VHGILAKTPSKRGKPNDLLTTETVQQFLKVKTLAECVQKRKHCLCETGWRQRTEPETVLYNLKTKIKIQRSTPRYCNELFKIF
jgi:hypothetical protein